MSPIQGGRTFGCTADQAAAISQGAAWRLIKRQWNSSSTSCAAFSRGDADEIGDDAQGLGRRPPPGRHRIERHLGGHARGGRPARSTARANPAPYNDNFEPVFQDPAAEAGPTATIWSPAIAGAAVTPPFGGGDDGDPGGPVGADPASPPESDGADLPDAGGPVGADPGATVDHVTPLAAPVAAADTTSAPEGAPGDSGPITSVEGGTGLTGSSFGAGEAGTDYAVPQQGETYFETG